jgi:hypothetical protein
MAKKNNIQNTTSIESQSFNGGMNKDVNDSLMPQGSYWSARNAVNNSRSGDLGIIGNEASNEFCTQAPYTIVGVVHVTADRWVVYSTDDVNSEIGLFDEELCKYITVVNDPCLAFSKYHLITGVSKEKFDCTWDIYWADGNNPDRTMNIGDATTLTGFPQPWPGVPYICEDVATDPADPTCITCEPILPLQLDCSKILLDPLVKQPCIRVERGPMGGELQNGSYCAVIAYVINEQRVTDYSMPSNWQPIFDHADVNGAINIVIEEIDETYDDFELVVIGVVNNKTVVKKIGIYSTHQKRISLDRIDPRLMSIPIKLLPVQKPPYEKSEAMYRVRDTLVRVAPTTNFDFNYQPLANEIVTRWQAVRYDKNYYKNGGSNTSYLRDEQYAFFIRWVYNTGSKSASYHIPGRAPANFSPPGSPATLFETDPVATVFGDEKVFEKYNTASITSTTSTTLPDGGILVSSGKMGYWESTEIYPPDKPEIWADLCGKPVRHHKMPDQCIINHFYDDSAGNQGIILLGVGFGNIAFPVDNAGNPIPGIVGYEILRGTREGNKTVFAKGIINNMWQHRSPNDEFDGEPGSYTGLHANYPFNDLNPDNFLSRYPKEKQESLFGLGSTSTYPEEFPADDSTTPEPLVNYKKDIFSFHSPDTNFRNPFLSFNELKIYGSLYSQNVKGQFVFPKTNQHPEHKLMTDTAIFLGVLGGIGIAFGVIRGNQKTRITSPSYVPPGVAAQLEEKKLNNVSGGGGGFTYGSGTISPISGGGGGGTDTTWKDLLDTSTDPGSLIKGVMEALRGTSGNPDALGVAVHDGTKVADDSFWNALIINTGTTSTPGNPVDPDGVQQEAMEPTQIIGQESIYGKGPSYVIEYEPQGGTGLPRALRLAQKLPTLAYYWSEGFDTTLRILKNIVKYQQYALAYQAHCYYDKYSLEGCGERRKIKDSNYISNHIQNFSDKYRINNLYRSNFVGLAVTEDIQNPSTIEENTRQTLNDFSNGSSLFSTGSLYRNPTQTQTTSAISYYAAIKNRLRNQYGQVDGIIQVPTSSCVQEFVVEGDQTKATSGLIFGGDTYINRYTEKNTFFYFYSWMTSQPDGFEYDYTKRYNIPYPTYWIDSKGIESSDVLQHLITTPLAILPGISIAPVRHNLDWRDDSTISLFANLFRLVWKKAYFYLFNSGVRDFYVESEVNVDHRDWEDEPEKRHYDFNYYYSLDTLFDFDIIKSGNFYKYDYSLSISKLYQEQGPWGSMQLRDYDPKVAETCYTYYPRRAIYSLPQTKEYRYDGWLDYLGNNYKDFESKVKAIKATGRTGAAIFFETQSPTVIPGVEELRTTDGTAITIGQGSLFDQDAQSYINSDKSYEYGSCQDKLSIISTPAGMYYICQNQGKIFSIGQGLEEISNLGLKWWFEEFLPYKLTTDFPTFELIDNPVAGIGCQAIYDNSDAIVYFSKRDFSLKPEFEGTYLGGDQFIILGVKSNLNTRVTLGDPLFFDDCSWTISYDPKTKVWVSFHDWHPNLMIPSKNNFMTVGPGLLGNQIWKHNDRSDSYCNFYGVDYPFEVDTIFTSDIDVNILKSVEFYMEAYVWDAEGIDKHHKLDFTFDRAVVYNSEQISGYLNLNLSPKNDPYTIINYPQVNPTSIDILYSKEEQKYRFNQFWDITDDRGEFTGFTRKMWETACNGYIRDINPNYVNYNKDQFKRKRFRHYVNRLWLQRRVSGDTSIWLKLIAEKDQKSLR